jgi:hypothetical protein
MKSLLECPVTRATAGEAAAYEAYLTEYSRYWREFFDPIAVRLDAGEDGGLALTAFILPLIDNSIYRGVRETLGGGPGAAPLRIPEMDRPPLLLFSVNLDGSWREEMSEQLEEGLAEMAPYADPQVLAALGPGLHLAVHDADPVVALGSGDILSAFGADMPSFLGEEMFMFPLIASVLTRPCTLFVESRDPERTRRFVMQVLSRAVAESGAADDGFSLVFYQVADRDAWVAVVNLAGLFKLRWGLEVQDQFFLVRNIPWSEPFRVQGAQPGALNAAALQIWPGACDKGLAGLFAADGERSRQAAMAALGHLYPLLAAGSETAADALDAHQRMFGFRPRHPLGGDWDLRDGELRSTLYGSPFSPCQPAYQSGNRDFGLLRHVNQASLSMQFEDSGLRAVLSWLPRDHSPAPE